MMLVVGHVYECVSGRRGLCVQCGITGCIIAWAAAQEEDWRVSVYTRNGKPDSAFAPVIAKQVHPL